VEEKEPQDEKEVVPVKVERINSSKRKANKLSKRKRFMPKNHRQQMNAKKRRAVQVK